MSQWLIFETVRHSQGRRPLYLQTFYLHYNLLNFNFQTASFQTHNKMGPASGANVCDPISDLHMCSNISFSSFILGSNWVGWQACEFLKSLSK